MDLGANLGTDAEYGLKDPIKISYLKWRNGGGVRMRTLDKNAKASKRA
jgi:hypothetical protein